MSIMSRYVLIAAALVASPALFHAMVTGTVTMDTAMQRYGLAVVAAWVALSALSMMVGPAAGPGTATAAVPASGATAVAPTSPATSQAVDSPTS